MRVKGKARVDGERPIIDVGDQLRLPREIEVTGEDDQGRTLAIRAEYSLDSGRYECRSLTVSAPDGGEITGEDLRSVPVAHALNSGIPQALTGVTLLTMGAIPDDITEGGPTTRALEWVAYLYRVAILFGKSPVSAVAEGLDLPRSTANRWVTRARDRGILTVQDKRGQRKGGDV